ncbi:MAG: SDR family NAD(P)-dependent oxidoreductase [Clostridium sp.]
MKGNVLITGSTSGMGYEWSKKFSKEGYSLILVSRNLRKLQIQKKELEALGSKVHIIQENLEDINAAKRLIETLENENLKVDILINNAGFNVSGSFQTTDLSLERNMINLHILFITEFTKLLSMKMVKAGEGKILNVGSTGSYISSPYDSVYSATKAYILSFSNAINHELKGTGVHVSTLCPGATKTEFAKKANIENTLLFKIGVMDSEKVISKAFPKFMKGKRIIIPGLYNKLLVLSSKITPAPLLNSLCSLMLKASH